MKNIIYKLEKNNEEKLKNPIKRLLPSICPKCGNNTVSMYDKRDNRINYPLLCRYNSFEQIQKKLENSDIRYMRCDVCKSIFILDWSKQIIPYPNTKDIYKEFEAAKNE